MSRRLYMTPAELAVQDAIEAAKPGEDPFGDANDSVLDAETLAEIDALNKPPADPPAPADDPAPTPAAEAPAAPADAPPPADPPAAPAAEAPAAPAPAPVPDVALGKDGLPVDLTDLEHLRLAPLPTIDEEGYLKTTSDLEAKIEAIDAQWEDGTITPEQRREQLKPLKTALSAAQVQHAADIGEYNAIGRMNQQQTQAVIERIKAAGLRDGLDYSDPAKAAQYDMATAAIARDPKNANLSWVQVSQKADLAVRAMNAIAPKTPAAAPAPVPVASTPAAPAPPAKPVPPPRPTPPAPPATLRDLPVAARAAEQSQTVSARLANSDANQRDAIWKTLTPAQRAAMLDE